MGVRVENRLSRRQALLNAPDSMTKKGLRDRARLAMLFGCGLRPVPRSLPLRWPTFSCGITDGASSTGSASMARVRAIPMPIMSRSERATLRHPGAVQAAIVESGVRNHHVTGMVSAEATVPAHCPGELTPILRHNARMKPAGACFGVRIDGNDYGASSPR
jgi:hypothetical protein